MLKPRSSPAPWKAGLSSGTPRGGRPNTCDLSHSHSTHGEFVAFDLVSSTALHAGLPQPALLGPSRGTRQNRKAVTEEQHIRRLGRQGHHPARTGNFKTSQNVSAYIYIYRNRKLRPCPSQTWGHVMESRDVRPGGVSACCIITCGKPSRPEFFQKLQEGVSGRGGEGKGRNLEPGTRNRETARGSQ